MTTQQLDLSERSVKQIVDGLSTAMRTSGGGGGGGGGVSLGPLTFALNSSVTVVDNLTTAMNKAMTGSFKFTDALNFSSKTLDLFGPFGKMLDVTAVKGARAFYELNEELKKTSQSGFYFGNDLLDFSESITSARISTDQFINFIAENGSKINVLGAGATDSARKLLDMSNVLQSTSPTIKSFLELGGSSTELNEILAITAQSMGALDLDNKKNKANFEAMNRVSEKLVTEFDNLSRITGINRKTLEQQYEKQRQRISEQLYIDGLTVQQRETYQKNTAGLQQLGGSIQDLFLQLSATGTVSQKSVADFSALGPEAGRLLKELAIRSKDANITEAERQALQNEFTARYRDFLYSDNSKQLAILADRGYTQNEYAKSIKKLQEEDLGRQQERLAVQRYNDNQRSEGQKFSLDYFREQVRLEALQDKERAAKGAEGTQISTMINKINQNIATSQAGIAFNLSRLNSVIEKGVTSIDSTLGISRAFNVGGSLSSPKIAADMFGGKLREEFIKELGIVTDKTAEYVENKLAPPGRTQDAIEASQRAGLPKDIIESLKTEMSNLTGAITKLSTPSPGAVSTTESTGLLNNAVEQLSKISNTMRELLDSSQQSVRQLKDVVTGVSNNRGK